MSELIGKTVGQYQIVEQIGAGGMATIFKAYQPSIDRYVAIKILPRQLAEDENFVKRFAHEAKAIAALEHPHILPVHDFGTEGKLNYMVMRYVKGGTLSNLMGKTLPYEKVVQIVGNVARALDYAHERGVVHRDIKPSNILIDEHGEVLLTDFGIAKMVESSKATQLTAAGSILGTPAYMSPEQAQGKEIDGRSDIYSLGVVLYELLTGSPPYEAETPFAIVLKHINDPLPPPRNVNPNIPEALERVVLKAMSKDPRQRFATAAQMEQALQNALKEMEGVMVIPRPSTSPGEPDTMKDVPQPPTPRPAAGKSSTGPLLIGGAVALILLCVLGGAGLIVLGLMGSSEDVSAVTPTLSSNVVSVGENSTPTPANPTATPTSEPTPEPTPTPEEDNVEVEDDPSNPPLDQADSEVLFEDDFDNNRNGWFVGQETDEYGEYDAEIGDGVYSVYIKATAEDGNTSWFQPEDLELDDFTYVVEVNQVEASADFRYGLTFRSTAEGDYYLFEVDNYGFEVWLYRAAAEEFEVLLDYTESSAIDPGGYNLLAVEADGPTMTFFINSEEVGVVEDDTLTSGSIGLAFVVFEQEEELRVEFEYLAVYALDGDTGGEEIIFADYFDSDAKGWATGSFEDSYSENEVTIADGEYRFTVTSKPEQAPYVEKKLPNQSFSDFILTVDAIPQDGEEYYSYGVAFRENSEGHTYAFEIGNDLLYGVFLFDGEWKTLKDWSSSGVIIPGEPNQITVIADGSSLSFIVNGETLTTLEDDTLSEGTVGFVIEMFEPETTAEVVFDNLILTSLE